MLERDLFRDRAILITGMFLIAALAWIYTIREANAMYAMHAGMDMSGHVDISWSTEAAIYNLLMWIVMMIAMMTPSIAPAVLLFALHSRSRARAGRPYVPASVFLAGYLLVWTSFSVAATAAHWGLEKYGFLNMMMEPASGKFSGIVLVIAGVFQFTPLKHACLQHCRGPLDVIMHGWKPGLIGALSTGMWHGAYCAGCCWALMLLLFAAGVMNIMWVALISIFVLIEKLAPRAELLARIAGAVLIATGIWLFVR